MRPKLSVCLVLSLFLLPACGESDPESSLNAAWNALCSWFVQCDEPGPAPPVVFEDCVQAHQLCNEQVPTDECAFAMANFSRCLASTPCGATLDVFAAPCVAEGQAWDEACGDIEPPIRFLEVDPVCQFNE